MPPSRVCPELLSKGTCSSPENSCQFSHKIYICRVCNRRFATYTQRDKHLKGSEHNRVIAAQFNGDDCRVCRFRVPSEGRYSHLTGKHHYDNLQLQQLQAQPEFPEIAPSNTILGDPQAIPPPGFVHCRFCNLNIRSHQWVKHIAHAQHTQKVQAGEVQAALRYSERDQRDVSATPSVLNFGLVNIEMLDAGKPVKQTLKVSAPVGVSLSSVVFASSIIGSDDADFSLQLLENKGRIRRAVTLPFTFSNAAVSIVIILNRSQEIGHLEDRLQLVFVHGTDRARETFVITRLIKATIGVKEDNDDLGPSAPYVPFNPVREKEGKIIPGVRPENLTHAELPIRTLNRWNIPYDLRKLLESDEDRSKIEKTVRTKFFPKELSPETYKQWFSTLICLEEQQSEFDIQRYNREDEDLVPNEPFYDLAVAGLAEKRPSLILGDRVVVKRDEFKHWYEGFVHKVMGKSVRLRFNNSFVGLKNHKYTVHFKLNRTVFRRMYQALADGEPTSSRLFFPTMLHVRGRMPPSQRALDDLIPFNRDLHTNPAQRLSVAGILGQSAGSPPFIVYGPPGTGKTATLVESIKQLLSSSDTRKFLACAPSNSAANVLAIRLKIIGKSQLLRLVAPSRSGQQVDSALQELMNEGFTCVDTNGQFVLPTLERLKSCRVVICTCTSAFWIHALGVNRGYFSHIFIDEAGQTYEPESTTPIRLLANEATNVIMAGDPQQLGPIVRSRISPPTGPATGLKRSYLVRLLERDPYKLPSNSGSGTEARTGIRPPIDQAQTNCEGITIVVLYKNFRNHASILKFSNERFYSGKLEACAPKEITHSLLRSQLVETSKFPVIFHHVAGKDEREAYSPSFFNISEASIVKKYITTLKGERKLRITDEDIGVISPYHAQCMKIGMIIKNGAIGVKVGSVEEFQGQERRIIIISTVRSSPDLIQHDVRHALGFVSNPQRFNVAVTRAKALLIVVGDSNILGLDPMWRAFLNYIYLGGGWVGKKPRWDISSEASLPGGDEQWLARMQGERTEAFRRALQILRVHENENLEGNGEDGNYELPWREQE
ncbi:hypothetical protein M422DRAFT_199403 [Sphaerobolus stellatus SS14]|nr:hypothetical protein M422DRAFT_199403 [Sphaerobolus stellatus SS14]